MPDQLDLFAAAAAPTAAPGLTCAFGEPWMGDHPKCRAATAEACREFDRLVAAGKYDAAGYTPRERAAKRARERA